MKKNKNGFTLAEVLITLVIIGIIAAMTIPTLMNKTNEQETVVAVKKAYSTLSQAYQRIVAENGEIYLENLGATRTEKAKNLGDMFANHLNFQENCGISRDGDCWTNDNGGWYDDLDGDGRRWMKVRSGNDDYNFILSDGSYLGIFPYESYYSSGEGVLKKVFAEINIDVNGYSHPNILGKDVFVFYLTQSGIIPQGSPYETDYSLSEYCRVSGEGCTAWVITKGNMDYLRKEVSW